MAFFQLDNGDTAQSVSLTAFHHYLLEKVQNIQQAILDNWDSDQITKLIKELKYEAVKSFAHQEKILLSDNSNTYHDHRKAHDQFIWKVSDLETEFNASHPRQALALCTQLQDWLADYQKDSGSQNQSFEVVEIKNNPIASP